ncbi:MAG TPA: single-stranded DNA-binding protein [Anaerolineae bacterium]|nr:single-stranded DNA-binding protein [Anaerolineae bacterium]MCB0178876.1 single-stranded DNA-binding protein [Anaerolineae bacterium]MCB0223909.1 single-stranded DNA-binding protein [Anaerolineae bacterium]MCB9106532.1 single-stranded DNA-binding protein [Anaerolineales bacterium]HRV92490.1 single-stranded DNA-binding protein [Anaerolineae bacterium]
MGRGLNKVMVIGNMGRDPEMRYTPSGKPVTSFSLASSRSWVAPGGERREETEWFNVVAWGGLAEICNQKLYKSQQVYVEGRLQTRSWEDDNGQRHFRTEIVASDMIILGPRDKAKLKYNRNGDDHNEDDDDFLSDFGDDLDN